MSIGFRAAQLQAESTPVQIAVASVQEKLRHEAPPWGTVEQTLIAPVPPTAPVIEEEPSYPPLLAFAFPGKEEMYPEIYAEMQRVADIEPLARFAAPSASVEKLLDLSQLIRETPKSPIYGGILPPGVSLPGLPDIFGGLKDIGKWILIGGAALGGIVLLSSFLKGRSK